MQLKEYFKQPYQGSQSFLDNVVFPIFGLESFEDGYNEELLAGNPELSAIASATGIAAIERVGKVYVGVTPIDIFDIRVASRVRLARNRVGVQQLVRRIMATYSSAFMLFHYDDADVWDWRFSFCSKRENTDTTDSKRFTFLLGPNQSCRTAADNFQRLLDKQGDIGPDDICEAFDVEALSREFFEKYKLHYERFVEYITGKRFVKEGGKWTEKTIHEPHAQMYEDFGRSDKRVRDYVKKLLGRIVFLHFLQKKGWLGVPQGKQWGEGDMQFMKRLFDCSSPEQRADFLDAVLEPLFAQGIDTEREGGLYDTGVSLPYGSTVRIPYLNGGLFERDALDEVTTRFPEEFFADLLDFFHQYNFTIDENDPNDAQVGVDPEMLGRIFENLLEDNKDKGAFYTPKEIVQYMCRQSLTAYLQTGIADEADRKAIAEFVATYNVGALPAQLVADVDQRLRDVKICDPAIGSGAFPMGLLKELFLCRGAIEDFSNATDIKRHIIQQNIYGVDIERGAVDIARLRFWLSLVVDEETPEALPNLDYKIMQGNSLLEQYQGVDLTAAADGKYTSSDTVSLFENMVDVYRRELRQKLSAYYDCADHDERKRLRREMADNVKQQLAEQGCRVDFAGLDLAANSEFFLWHTWFYDVFAQGGFDIVIGNPPYIQLQNNGGELAKIYEHRGYETFARTGDIYCLFYECGRQLLKQGGHLCFITSNKWMRAGYGEKTRQFFATKTNPKLLIDFAGVRIFESATVDTNILLFAREDNRHQTVCAMTSKHSADSVNNLDFFVRQNASVGSFDSSDTWVILSNIEQSIKRKIEAVGTPLKDWDIQMNYGIKTGCNEAFIITAEKRDEILANCQTEDERQRTAEQIRPILRGRDIKRYAYEWANLYLIYIPWHFPYQFDESIQGASLKAEHAFMEQYPAVYAHMFQYKEQLSKRNKAETGIRYEWYAMQRWGAKYWADFDKPKIVWGNLNLTASYALVEDNSFINAPSTMIVPASRFLLAVLNSKLADYYIRQLGVTRNGGYFEYKPMFIEQLPVPKDVDALVVEKIEGCVTKSDSDMIDALVYRLYGLSYDEVLVIDPGTAITREDYDNLKTETLCHD